jgi:putative MATE family efflux protein
MINEVVKKSGNGLTQGPIAVTLMRFSWPLLVTLTLHNITGSWNAAWVSLVLGPSELVAVVNANVLLGIFMAFVSGFGIAAGIFVGQAIGAADIETARKVVGSAISFAIAAGMLTTIVCFLFVESVIDFLQMPEEIRENAIIYFQIFSLSLPTLFVFIFSTMLLRSAGDARTPFIFSIIWIVLGFALTPLLLTGVFGLPRFGIAGAAMSGWIANTVALVAMYIYIYRKNLPLALRRESLHYLRPNKSLLWQLAKRAIPSGAETWAIHGAYFVLLSIVNAQGVIIASGFAAAAQLWGYVMLPTFAIAGSMSTMAAQNIGANQWGRIDRIALQGCMLAVLSTTSMAVVVYSSGKLLLTLFLQEGSEALQAALDVNAVVLWAWPMIAISYGLFGIIRANGVMLPSVIIFALTMWGVRLPFAYFMQTKLGAAAIWWSFPVATLSAALLTFTYYRWGKWRQQTLL